VRALLDENGFVHLCGLPDTSDLRAIVVLGSVQGQLFTDLSHQSRVVVEASPAPGATLQGNRTGTLFPHTDFVMLERPPAVSIIRCAAEDPVGQPFGCKGCSWRRTSWTASRGRLGCRACGPYPCRLLGVSPPGRTFCSASLPSMSMRPRSKFGQCGSTPPASTTGSGCEAARHRRRRPRRCTISSKPPGPFGRRCT
jgi:hypothetical protein